ncbi:hypothetical protein RhiirA4_480722 [Rhizophagus irregularis]|uniref:Uncharacterized protein n=1 Tax=Rhizophagus irregularis TaxID=588596 RepID=A0A2I1HIE3_9GLOM|nr:hypothetical protein RhiirA4_480722 [Rhizophagus irregularis]
MIPLENWIPDELHIMLRIWDHLWSLLLAELKECDQFDDVCRNEIMQEMSRIGVHFQFWKETGSNAYNHTSLMGDDKLNDYNAQQFKFESEDWLELFLTSDRAIPNSTRIEKGLYKPSAITPYIHVLVYHMAEFMEKHSRWSVKAFFCAPVEKQNHQQVTNFFRQTLKDKGSKKKLAIIEILEYENRALFYLFNNVEISISKPKKKDKNKDKRALSTKRLHNLITNFREKYRNEHYPFKPYRAIIRPNDVEYVKDDLGDTSDDTKILERRPKKRRARTSHYHNLDNVIHLTKKLCTFDFRNTKEEDFLPANIDLFFKFRFLN